MDRRPGNNRCEQTQYRRAGDRTKAVSAGIRGDFPQLVSFFTGGRTVNLNNPSLVSFFMWGWMVNLNNPY
jgi:hypothetical protein